MSPSRSSRTSSTSTIGCARIGCRAVQCSTPSQSPTPVPSGSTWWACGRPGRASTATPAPPCSRARGSSGSSRRGLSWRGRRSRSRSSTAAPPGRAAPGGGRSAGRSSRTARSWRASRPGAPTWFPCNDRPDDRARYRIVVTTDEGYRVAATGVPLSPQRVRGRTQWEFTSDVPVATYLAAVHIGRYTERRLGPVRLVHPPALAAAVTEAFRDVPAHAGPLREVLRAVSAGALHDRRHRGRPRDPPRSPGARRLRREPPRSGLRAPRRPRAGPSVVRQQRRHRPLARHLAQRGLRLLRRMAVVRGSGVRHRRTRWPTCTTRACGGSRAIWC